MSRVSRACSPCPRLNVTFESKVPPWLWIVEHPLMINLSNCLSWIFKVIVSILYVHHYRSTVPAVQTRSSCCMHTLECTNIWISLVPDLCRTVDQSVIPTPWIREINQCHQCDNEAADFRTLNPEQDTECPPSQITLALCATISASNTFCVFSKQRDCH